MLSKSLGILAVLALPVQQASLNAQNAQLAATILSLAVAVGPARGVDLTKVDRAIGKEPVYQSKTPKYCLLVFGAEATLRSWLVLDGDVLYVDRDGNGDLTGANERVAVNAKRRVFEVGAISFAGGKVQYTVSLVRVKDKGLVEIYVDRPVDFGYRKTWGKDTLMEMAGLTDISFRSWMNRDNIEEYDFQFGASPQAAPIVHLDGPLTLKAMDKKQVFIRGDMPTRFPVMVGSPGLGKGTFTQLLFVPGDPDGLAEIAFPHREPGRKAIVVQVTLKAPT